MEHKQSPRLYFEPDSIMNPSQSPAGLPIGKQVRRLLKASLPHPCPIEDLMEMRWALLLLINLLSETSKQSPADQSTWVEKIIETAGTDFTDTKVRVKTGQIVAEILAGSPWGLQTIPGSNDFQANISVRAVFDGMVEWTREINRTINKHIPVADQKRYDVEEAWSSDDEDEGPIPGYEPDDEQDRKLKSQTQSPQSDESAVEKPRTRNESAGEKQRTRNESAGEKPRIRRNNTKYPRGLSWTPRENLALLKQYRTAPRHADGRPATHQQVADLHNASYYPNGEYIRTKVALQQQMKILVKGGRAGIGAKIAELEREDDGDGGDEQMVSETPRMKYTAALSKEGRTGT